MTLRRLRESHSRCRTRSAELEAGRRTSRRSFLLGLKNDPKKLMRRRGKTQSTRIKAGIRDGGGPKVIGFGIVG